MKLADLDSSFVLQLDAGNVSITTQLDNADAAIVEQRNVNNIPTNTMYNVQASLQPKVVNEPSHVQHQLPSSTPSPIYSGSIQQRRTAKTTSNIKVPSSTEKTTSNIKVHSSTVKTTYQNLNRTNRAAIPFINSSAAMLPLKSFSSFPIFGAPKGISKDELIKKHADRAVHMLTTDGYCVIDELLGEEKLNNIIAETESLFNSGIMRSGDVIQLVPGRNEEERVRSDKIVWVSGEEEICANIKSHINVIDQLITFCAAGIQQTIKGRTQAMVACYLGDGGGYKHHIDNSSKDGRAITVIYYLNAEWSKPDGGMLKLYPLASRSFLEIEPTGDRLVMFWSDCRSPHEVKATFRKRFAITLWYFDAEEREEMRKQYVKNLEKRFAGNATPIIIP